MDLNYRQIIAEQREELAIIESQGWVPRENEKMVNTDSRLVQIITGVRRSGKSTLYLSNKARYQVYLKLGTFQQDNVELLPSSIFLV